MKKIIMLCGLLLLTFLWGMLELKYGNGAENRGNQANVSPQENMGSGRVEETGTQNENGEQREIQSGTEGLETDESESGIRVLLKSDGYESEYHTDICLTCDKDYTIQKEDSQIRYKAGEEIQITPQSDLFAKGEVLQAFSNDGRFYFPELERAETDIGYEGSLEIRKTDQGLLLVNVLPLESYLCGVLPSEMSEAFLLEALKAQAICARTYAMQQQESGRAEEYGADLDDSTSYQVYNNRRHGAKTDQAVKETAGLVMMMQDGALADARYYSTSCGLDLHRNLSEESVFAAFLQEDQISSVEAEEPFYRWKTNIQLVDLQEKTEWEKIENLQVAERNEKGAATCLEITGQRKTVEQDEADADQTVTSEEAVQKIETEEVTEKIIGEYQIRQFLALADLVITLQDGSTREGWQLLPSAFFYLQPVTEGDILTGYDVYGGGYGHGEGMSQNGARHMAEQGEDCETILKNYYGEIELVKYSS
ncbi:H-34 [uncultured Clostridium sp.]|uniref:SpoIID/LytB domain-containing protein n=1 Tax=Muricoprocola aceti TaxID=2981772 RepID=A0ABT2SQ63_9FIRM|nr:SpoIID/LytB domain-containing protein [Muricoprocola aceti]MCU6726658.1 SpoIID/LytB domain-containing protein [Muricoprocola aceti]SCH98252.1 H-34 [uncultured Clostridium sp.]